MAGRRTNPYSSDGRRLHTVGQLIAVRGLIAAPLLTSCVLFAFTASAHAESSTQPKSGAGAKRSAASLDAGIFNERFDVNGIFDRRPESAPQPVAAAQPIAAAQPKAEKGAPAGAPVAMPAPELQAARPARQPANADPAPEDREPAFRGDEIFGRLDLTKILKKPVYVSDQPPSSFPSPDTDPSVRINPDAPVPAIAMIIANQNGDREMALAYAKQLLRYQENFFFEVRQLTSLLGQAMIDQHIVDDDEWAGVGQMIEFEFAKARQEAGAMLKPTHDKAMERIKPDPKHEAEIYYFFTMHCSWCRKMAPDVERLHRVAEKDKRLKMVALTLNKIPKSFVTEYRAYTGLTLPILQGWKQAKAFGVRFAPALVVVSPNNKVAYLKTGQQTFERMYDFVRRVQGLPSTLSPELAQLISEPIGEVEQLSPRPMTRTMAGNAARTSGAVMMPVRAKASAESIVGRF